MYQFKVLPWQQLINASVITLVLASVIDYGLTLILPASSQVQIEAVLGPPWGLLSSAAIDMAIGILGVIILERVMEPRRRIQVSTLWGLVLCLLIALALRASLPIPGLFLGPFHQITIVGLLLGVFSKGQQYRR
ncbi:hypothetical protein [Acaryochloris sp. CCMEE 5410]|uniref:hypothetical protein n=1 Tax=Acaryochloris sp. CCMEE 5410 TaxID=310037 RepID=UPI0002483FAB|nr:hypothetical protein [Acaryochloris sp. CCMEE 5410]KAI9131026.1 hypothetical protein ON05_025430 [Acaryochloris sp. CCMEE 5410]